MKLDVIKLQERLDQLLKSNTQAIANANYTKGAFDAYNYLLNPEANGGLTSVEEPENSSEEGEESKNEDQTT